MDLKELKLKEEKYSDIREKTIKVIDEYISIYNEYKNYYDNEWSNWISKIIEEFKVIYGELGFELKSEKKVGGYSYYDKFNPRIYEIATFNSLEFQLMIELNGELYESVRFLQTKPKSSEINENINPSIKRHKIHIDFSRAKDGVIKSANLGTTKLNVIEEIKQKVLDREFKIESLEEAYNIFNEEKNGLEIEANKIKNSEMFGSVFINKKVVQVKNLDELIKLL